MKMSIVAKVRLYPTDEQRKGFVEISKEYQRLCNIVSQWYFDNHFEPDRKTFQKDVYPVLRKDSPINSAMVQSVYRTVVARYKSISTQMKQRPRRYKDQYMGEWHTRYLDLNDLQHSVKFRRPQADYRRQANYSFVNHNTQIAMNVLGERVKVNFKSKYINLWDSRYKLGTAKLVQLKGKWYFHIPVTFETADWDHDSNQKIVGIDRGLRQIVTIYDSRGNTKFINGRAIAYKRRKYYHLRKQLQKAGTKSAKRHLKKLEHRENRWMSDVNHQISKTLVDRYGDNVLYVLEDLANVNFEKQFATNSQTRDLHSWAFYDLQQKLAYKANMHQSKVITVDASYTSQRCPRCGIIKKDNRNHQLHLYQCENCGFSTNDDRVGAMNLYELGKQYMTGDEHPSFKDVKIND